MVANSYHPLGAISYKNLNVNSKVRELIDPRGSTRKENLVKQIFNEANVIRTIPISIVGVVDKQI